MSLFTLVRFLLWLEVSCNLVFNQLVSLVRNRSEMTNIYNAEIEKKRHHLRGSFETRLALIQLVDK